MKLKIWAAEQLPMVQELVLDSRIPKAVADETLRVVSILDDMVLDKSQAYIHVQRAIVEDERGNLVEKPTKTKAGKRIIPLIVDGTVYRILQKRHTYITACTNIEGFSELSLIGTVGHSTIDNSKRYQHPLLQKTLSDMEKLEKTFTKIKA